MLYVANAKPATFLQDFCLTWSDSHIKQHDGGKGIQVLDQNSGCGFALKSQYLFGGVSLMIKLIPGESMKIKLIPRDVAGTVTAFYILNSWGTGSDNHTWSKPMCLHMERVIENKELTYGLTLLLTSIRIPSYGWNHYHVVFSVDEVHDQVLVRPTQPIGGRVHGINSSTHLSVMYCSHSENRKLLPCYLQDRPPELIGKLLDEKLRAGNKGNFMVKVLELNIVCFYGAKYVEKFLVICLLLQELRLIGCFTYPNDPFSVSCPKLKSLTIRENQNAFAGYKISSSGLKVSCPELVVFECVGLRVKNHFIFEQVDSLRKAVILPEYILQKQISFELGDTVCELLAGTSHVEFLLLNLFILKEINIDGTDCVWDSLLFPLQVKVCFGYNPVEGLRTLIEDWGVSGLTKHSVLKSLTLILGGDDANRGITDYGIQLCFCFPHYIGCLTRVNDVRTLGNANTSQTVIRILDIKNLNDDVVELTLRDEIARTFAKDVYDQMERPVFIAVSFCELSKYRGLQLSATLATYYYLNPYILDIEAIRDQFALSTLLQQNPDGYRVNGSQEESERSQRAAIEKRTFGDHQESLDAGRSSHVYHLLRKGNKALRDTRYEEAEEKAPNCYAKVSTTSEVLFSSYIAERRLYGYSSFHSPPPPTHLCQYPPDIKEHKKATLGAVSLDDVYLDQVSVDFVLDSDKKRCVTLDKLVRDFKAGDEDLMNIAKGVVLLMIALLHIKEHKKVTLGAVSLDDVYLDQVSVDFVFDSDKKRIAIRSRRLKCLTPEVAKPTLPGANAALPGREVLGLNL
ncbi:F-box domain containing protein [Tanacetum coccineum]